MTLFFVSLSYAQKQENLWSKTSTDKVNKENVIFYKSIPKNSTLVSLDLKSLKLRLSNAPKRDRSSDSDGVIIDFPNQEGNFESYLVKAASVMSPELQSQFPEIRSYIGKGINNPTSIVRFSVSPEKGLSSMALSDKKTVFIEPYSADLRNYIVFNNSNEDGPRTPFECTTEYVRSELSISDEQYAALRNANDQTLRTYRLALACTVEYAQFHGGTLAGVMSAMNITMTRVNAVFERDLGLTMVMVPNSTIIFLGPDVDSDPYTNNSGGTMLGQNQTTCDTNIGTGNYDIGHVFSTGGGGVAFLNSPCNNGSKAGGVTGSFSPVGDTFDIDYVAHEMGHQFGGNHTQNNNCQRSGVSVEPGSASTIMGYAGICAPNVQNNSDDYFHGENIKEMWLNISAGTSSTCFTGSSTSNVAPQVNAGSNVSIPKSTAFVLRGTATDADTASGLTYCWEQIDATPATMPPLATNTGGPAFRSLDPTASPDRYMPALNTVMSGSLSTTWEVVPSVSRDMNFSLTVRDNELNGGATGSSEMMISVEDVTPFTVITPPSWGPSSSQQISWVLGESSGALINCQLVNILFTTNNGGSFTTLASGVPNTGTATITVPNVPNTNNAKVLVEAADNIFYAVSSAFSISNVADFSVGSISGDQTACNIDEVSFNFSYTTSNGFSETTGFTVSGVPSGAISSVTPPSLSSNGTVTVNLTNLNNVTENNYIITLTAMSTSITKSADVNLLVTSDLCPSNGNLDWQTRITSVIFNTINNTNINSKFVPYSDFTNMSTDVDAGNNYDLSIQGNSDGNVQVITRAWIDWNQNCSFNDPGEEYDFGTSFNLINEPVGPPLTITVPNDAIDGNTTMRISIKYTDTNANQFPTSCETGFDGEVEDYSLNITNNLSINDNKLENLAIYPNPNNGEFNIGFNPKSGKDIKVAVYDIRGRAIFANVYNSVSRFEEVIRLNNAQSGVYLLTISDGPQKVTKKIIVD